MSTKLINIRLSEEFIDKIKAFSKKNDMSVSTLIRLALKEYMNNHKED